MIETNLIYAKTKSGFQTKLDASEVKNTSIAFIEDSNEIWTNGHYWPCPYSKEELDNLLAQKITSELLELELENKLNTLESGAIPSISKELTNEDLNTITNPGFYYAKEDNTVTNKPSSITSFGVVVYPVSDTAYMLILYRDDNCQYHRIHNGSDWSNWERELTTTDSASFVRKQSNRIYVTSDNPYAKLFDITTPTEKGYVCLLITDANNTASDYVALYMIGWPFGDDKTLSLECIWARNNYMTTALYAVKTSDNHYDIYYKPENYSSKVGYTILNYSENVISTYYNTISPGITPTYTSITGTIAANISGNVLWELDQVSDTHYLTNTNDIIGALKVLDIKLYELELRLTIKEA